MALYVTVQCAHCGNDCQKCMRDYNQAMKLGRKLFCNKVCFGASRALEPEERDRRIKARHAISVAKKPEQYKKMHADWYQRNRDPEKEKLARKAKMPAHVEYCRRPEYKEYKRRADIEIRMRPYGEYGEAYRLLLELTREIRKQCPDKYERLKARGYFDRERVRERKTAWARIQSAINQ